MVIPGDPEGRSWAEATFADQRGADYDPVLLSLMAWGPDRNAELIGTGFTIAAFGRQALAITAAHNLIEAAKIQRPWSLSHPTALAQFTVGTTRTVSADPKSLRALYMRGEDVDACIIRGISFVPELDVALIKLELQEHTARELFAERMALDTSVPKPGMEVCALGYGAMKIRHQEAWNNGFERIVVERRVTLRRGVITNVHLGGERVPWPCFETTIPIERGMSGGPVFCLPHGPGEKLAVCGMIAQDFSPAKAGGNCAVAGSSTAAMLWPALGLAIQVAEAGGAPQSTFLIELIRRGLIEDFGSAATEARVVSEKDGRVTISRTVG